MTGRRGRAAGLPVAAGLLAGALCGCDDTVQRQRLATCSRAVPALAPSEGTVKVLRTGAGATPDSVRVDYAVGPRQHWAVCRFGSGAVLSGITRDGTALTGASLYLLKHYYLDAPESGPIERVDR